MMMKTMLAVATLASVVFCSSVPISAQNGDGWGRISNAAARFKVLADFNSQAVLDSETGLLWERSPGDTNGDGFVDQADRLDWAPAHLHCNNKVIGNRKGWRLPTIQELASLIDPAAATPPNWANPAITMGHPFSVQITSYWSATNSAFYAQSAWYMFLGDGNVNPAPYNQAALPWCVRFRQGVDAQ